MKIDDVAGELAMPDALADLIQAELKLRERPALVLAVQDSPAAPVWVLYPQGSELVYEDLASGGPPEKMVPGPGEVLRITYPGGAVSYCTVILGVPRWFSNVEVEDYAGEAAMTGGTESQLKQLIGLAQAPACLFVLTTESVPKVRLLHRSDKSVVENDLGAPTGPYQSIVSPSQDVLLKCLYPDAYLLICGVTLGVPWWRP